MKVEIWRVKSKKGSLIEFEGQTTESFPTGFYELSPYKEKTKPEVKAIRKPSSLKVWEGTAECLNEDYDDLGGGAFCVQVDCPSLYEAKEVRKLIKWLEKAEKWMENKELYKKPGRRKKENYGGG